MKRIILLSALVCAFSLLDAQMVLERRNDIPVTESGNNLRSAWAGGLNNPQFSSIDLNRDGIFDLVAFDRADNRIVPFLNRGTAGITDYDYAPEYADSFPDSIFYGWVLMRDFNGDGQVDIFTSDRVSQVHVYKNISNAVGHLAFSLYVSPIYSNYPPNLIYYVASIDIPGIYDVDGDGDLDFMNFDVLGGSVELHRNLSAENGWGSDSIRLALQSFCFGHFHESGLTCTAFINDPPCSTGMNPPLPETAHSGSTLLAIDLDSNNLVDLVIGDVGCETMYALRNGGTMQVAHFDSLEENYPIDNVPVRLPMFPAAFYVDVSNDGVSDMLVAPNLVGDCEDKVGVWYYKNMGTLHRPDFVFQDSGFVQKQMIENGTAAKPAFFDFDQDSLPDLLVGNRSIYTSPPNNRTSFSLYRNTGTRAYPRFTLHSDDYLGLSTHPTLSQLDDITPAFADLDHDGDDDLYFGEASGGIVYFENTAPAGDTARFQFVSANYSNLYAGSNPAPTFYDLDRDNDLDLIIGNRKGLLTFYRNTGSISSASWQKITDSLGLVKINDMTGQAFSDGYSKPFVCDHDNDGTDELLVGGFEGEVHVFGNLTGSPGAAFTDQGTFPHDYGMHAAPAAAKLDSSGNFSFVIGNQRGGLHLIGSPLSYPVSRTKGVAAHQISISPNPFTDEVHVTSAGNIIRHIDVCDLAGSIIRRTEESSYSCRMDLSSLAPGVYLILVKTDKGVAAGKVVKR